VFLKFSWILLVLVRDFIQVQFLGRRISVTAISIEREDVSQVSASSLTVEQAQQYINSLDFSMIIKKMVVQQGWQKENAIQLSQLYKNFLFLNFKYGAQFPGLPPSEEIDEFWHNHVLDTQSYIRDCQKIFGRYLHHYPYSGLDGKMTSEQTNDAFENMQELHCKEFGCYIPRVSKKQFLYPLLYLSSKVITILGFLVNGLFKKHRRHVR